MERRSEPDSPPTPYRPPAHTACPQRALRPIDRTAPGRKEYEESPATLAAETGYRPTYPPAWKSHAVHRPSTQSIAPWRRSASTSASRFVPMLSSPLVHFFLPTGTSAAAQ